MTRSISIARPPLSLQRLDDRLCPSVSVDVLDGHILRVLGDEEANAIAVIDRGGGAIQVAFEGKVKLFEGIDSVLVRSGGGDDVVTFARHLPGQSTVGRAADLFLDLGAGDDTFRLIDPGAAGASTNSPLVRIDGGDGRDTVGFIYGGGGGSGRLFEPNDDIEARLGRGDDTFAIQLPVSTGSVAAADGHEGLTVMADGGAGNDTFVTSATEVYIEDPNLRPAVRGAIDLKYDGGAGDDTFDTVLAGVDLDTTASFQMDGGAGRDTFVTSFKGVTFNAPAEYKQFGGGGSDTILNTWAGRPVVVNAPLLVDLSGGGGSDDIRVISGFNPQPDPPAAPLLVLNSRLTVRLDGGAGDDVLVADIIPCIRPAGSLTVSSDGGAGDDVVVTAVFVDVEERSRPGDGVSVTVAGGEGNDRLGLAVVVPEGTGLRTDFRIDGGAGIDTLLFATPNVRVRDCER